MSSNNTEELEARLTEIEDRLAIYTLIASHPPSADTADAEYILLVYLEDSVFDRGASLDGTRGIDAIIRFTLKRTKSRGPVWRRGLFRRQPREREDSAFGPRDRPSIHRGEHLVLNRC